MVPLHVRRCFAGLLPVQLAHLVVDLAKGPVFPPPPAPRRSRAKVAVVEVPRAVKPKHKPTAASKVFGIARVKPLKKSVKVALVLTANDYDRILARVGSRYAETGSALAASYGKSESWVKQIRRVHGV
jgi:hypothetical protein